jgi:hypothetical protein
MLRAWIVTLAIVTGCSSNYYPQSRGRVAITIAERKLVYVRDGRSYPHGLLGGGLVDAVAGNPAAETAANTYHSRMTTGFIAALLGLVAIIGGTAGIADASASENPKSSEFTTALLFTLGGTITSVVGIEYSLSAEPYRWDAINLFNDGGDRIGPGPPGLPGPPPVQTPPPTERSGATGTSRASTRTSLHMRD